MDAPALEARVRELINEHFDLAERRIPAFLDEHYRSFDKVMWRNIRGLTDSLVWVRNKATWPLRKLGGPNLSTTTWTEDTLRRLFVEELVQVRDLERSLQALQQQIGNAVDDQLRELRSSPHLAGKTPKEVEEMILRHLGSANSLADEVKDILTAGAFAIASYLVAGKLKASLAPVGAAVAGSLYLSQAGFFAGLWYGIVGVPAWVGIVGAAAGAGIALLVAPILGGVIEYGMNHRSSLEEQMRVQMTAVRKTLLDGKHDEERTTESVIAAILRQRELARDFVDTVRMAVA
jgi:hypothetical protein